MNVVVNSYDWISKYNAFEIILWLGLGIVILIALYRLALWLLDGVIAGLFWALLDWIRNIPNYLKRKGGGD